MKNKGQNLTEFGIIIALIAVGSILVLTVMGGNVAEMMNSSSNKFGMFDPFNVKGQSSNIGGGPTGSTITETRNIDATDVDFYDDGSASFTYNGQTVTLSDTVLSDLNNVFETSGADGMTTEVMSAIQQMIDEHKAEYEPAEVPINLVFGDSDRDRKHSDESYSGSAAVNMVSMQVGNDMKIIVKDQDIEHGTGRDGIYVIEGTLGTTKFNNESIMYYPSSGDPAIDIGYNDKNISYSTNHGKIHINYNEEKIYNDAPGLLQSGSQWDWDIEIPVN